MARQVNGQLKGAQGKVGDVTYYTMNGQTYARKANTDQTNPQTTAQMSRRVRLANVVAMYRAGIAWSKKSYQNKLRVQSDYNKFVQQNFNSSLVALTREQVELGACVVAPYMVTRGSIPSIHLTPTPSGVFTSIAVGDASFNANSRIGEWTEAIVRNNPTILPGDQLSVIFYEQKVNVDTNIPYVICRQYEATLDPMSGDKMYDFIPQQYMSIAQQGTEKVVATSGVLPMGGIVYVISRNTRRGLEVSTQSIAMTSMAVLSQYVDATQLQAAMESYGLSPDAFLNPDQSEDAGPTPSSLEMLGLGLGIPSKSRDYTQNPVSYWVSDSQRMRYAFADGVMCGFRFNQEVTFAAVTIDTWGNVPFTGAIVQADNENPLNTEKVYYCQMPSTVQSSQDFIKKITLLNGGVPVYVIDGFPNGDTD